MLPSVTPRPKYQVLSLLLFLCLTGGISALSYPSVTRSQPAPAEIYLPIVMHNTVTVEESAVPDYTDHHDMSMEELEELVKDFPPFERNAASTRNNLPVSTGGSWGEVIAWPHIPVSAANLPDGRLITWASNQRTGFPGGQPEQTYTATWDPETNEFVEYFHDSHDMFCAHQVMLEEGEVFVNGGRNFNRSVWTSTFDFRTDTWERKESMTYGRWYPTSLVMPGDEVFIAIGSNGHRYPELYTPGSGWDVKTGIDMQSIIDYKGEYNRPDWWPQITLAPSGDILHMGPTPQMHWIDPAGNGTMTPAGVGISGWDSGNQTGTHVVYEEGKILALGGKTTARRYMTIDMNGDTPAVSDITPPNTTRQHANVVMLPTGEVMMIGGSTTAGGFNDIDSVLIPEIWNPTTNTWREMNEMDIPRNYHSTALLLPDGRVFSGGGGLCGNCAANHQDAQVFSPPYLLNADGSEKVRPQILAAPDVVKVEERVAVIGSNNIERFTMVRMSSTTHAVNTDQRFLNVDFTKSGTVEYQLRMNDNVNVLLPGYWMLFGLDGQGTPSESKIIQVSSEGSIVDPNMPTLPDIEISPIISPPKEQNQAVVFTANATGTGLQYKWLFGDGTPESGYSDSVAISHSFATPGRYLVQLTVRDRNGSTNSIDFTQSVYGTPTANKPVSSMSVMVDTSNRVWNVNPDNDTVSAFNTSNNRKLAEITVGDEPRSLAQAPDGRIWVANTNSSTISIINPNNMSVAQTVNMPAGSLPYGLAFAPNGSNAYVALEGTGQLLKLNPANGAIVDSVDVGPNPRHISVLHGSGRVYVSRFVTPPVPGEATANPNVAGRGGEVVVVLTSNMSIERTIILQHSDAPDAEKGGRGLPNYLGAPAVSPDGESIWVPSKQDNILRGSLRDRQNLDHDNSVRAITSRINRTGQAEDYGARIDHDDASVASAAVYGPFGNYMFVALEGNREVSVVDAYGEAEIGRFDVGFAPQGLALSNDGSTLYVHNFMDRTVSAHNILNIINLGEIDVATRAVYNTVANESLTPTVLAGKKLFYDARDERLAAEMYMSCASCHNGGGEDGRVWDFTGFGEGVRNTISLEGHGDHGMLHWSGNFNEVHDFEQQIRAFAGGTGLMSDSDFNARIDPLGLPKAGISSDLDALAAYVNSLQAVPNSPYRSVNGGLTTAGEAGKQVFVAQGCASCHGGTEFTDSDTGVRHNIGTLTGASGGRLNGQLDGLDTPTLQGLWMTAPYLHDGSAGTLAEAVNAHNGINLAGSDLSNLVAYLNQIDEREPEPGSTNPNSAPVLSNPGNQTAQVGATVSLQLNASDADGDGLSFSGSGLPAGLNLNNNSGLISGTPAAAGQSNVTITVSDGNGGSDSISFNWAVEDDGGPPPPPTGLGQITWEYWNTSWGTTLDVLRGTPNFPDNPTNSSTLTSFEAPVDRADIFGQRISGTLNPTVTGDYTFWIASDDQGELWLSTDSNAANLALIASVPDWTLSREWDKFPSQQSQTVTLQAGQAYYVEALSQDGAGGDNLAVAWQAPGGSREVIPGQYLSTADGGGGPTPPPTQNNPPVLTNPGPQSGEVGVAVNLQLTATDADNDSLSFSSPGLPAGLSLNSSTGRITGTPQAATSLNVNVTVNDGRGGTNSVSFLWTIIDSAPPVIRDYVFDYTINRSSLPNLNYAETTLNVYVGPAARIEARANGQVIPHTFYPTSGYVAITTDQANIRVSVWGTAASERAGKFHLAPLKDNKAFAWSIGFDDNTGFEPAIEVMDDYGYRGTVYAIASIIDDTREEGWIIDAPDLKRYLANGWSVGSHGWSTACDDANRADMIRALDRIEEIVAQSARPDYLVTNFAAPCFIADYHPIIMQLRDENNYDVLFNESGGDGLMVVDPGVTDAVFNGGLLAKPLNLAATPTDDFTRTDRDDPIGRDLTLESDYDRAIEMLDWMAENAENGNAFWYNTFLHAHDGVRLGNFIGYMASNYGEQVLVAPADEIYSYLLVRDLATVSGGTGQEADPSRVDAPDNNRPKIENPGTLAHYRGNAVNVQLIASDADGDSLTYTAAGLPNGVSLNRSSGLLSGTATQNGNFSVAVTVNDGRGGERTATFVWIIEEDTTPPPPANPTGQINWEVWNTGWGTSIGVLTELPNFPNAPDISGYRNSFAAPIDRGDIFGQRIRGWVYPPVTGNYQFWIASDDEGKVWLSSDETRGNAMLIARVPTWTTPYNWDSTPEQKSGLIWLEAGQPYFIEALAQEGGGGDHLAVAWQIPGQARELIDGQYLAPMD